MGLEDLKDLHDNTSNTNTQIELHVMNPALYKQNNSSGHDVITLSCQSCVLVVKWAEIGFEDIGHRYQFTSSTDNSVLWDLASQDDMILKVWF